MKLESHHRPFTWQDMYRRAERVAQQIIDEWEDRKSADFLPHKYVYPIPNGGIPAALLVAWAMHSEYVKNPQGLQLLILGDDPAKTGTKGAWNIYVDDLVDSGKTKLQYTKNQPFKFYALIDKQKEGITEWCVMPWEYMAKTEGPEDNINRILQYIGEDPTRPGLRETPQRVTRSYAELFAGYKQNPADYCKVFEEATSDAMVVLKDVEFYSTCEHHMQPFFGRVDIAYLPGREVEASGKYRVIGVSKLARIFDVFARRLQIQERLCDQFTQFLMNSDLKPLGVACVVRAEHFCIRCRGVGKQNSLMITSSLEGVFRDKPEVRAEFYSLIGR